LLGVASPDALLYLGLIAAEIALVLWCARHPTGARWRIRLLYYPIAMNLPYVHLGKALTKVNASLCDAQLQSIDTLLVGTNLSLRIQPWVHPVLTDILSLSYMIFIPYLWLSLFVYWVGDLVVLKRFYAGLFTIYGIGFLGYSLVPAAGPYLAMAPQFRVPLEGTWLTEANAAMVWIGSNRVDVFPSLHCAASAFMLSFDHRHKPWRYQLYLLPCLGLWLATIYLRYHYVVDCLCGFALFGFAVWVVARYSRTERAAVVMASRLRTSRRRSSAPQSRSRTHG
jgi:hypothetical protein